jgi:hypothetical protein
MVTINGPIAVTNTASSFYQIGLPIDGRNSRGSGNYPRDLCRSDWHLISLRRCDCTMFPIQEAPVELCGGDGGMITSISWVVIAKDTS